MRRALAYIMSLVVLGAATWTPYTAYAQVLPGSPFGGGTGGATYPVSDAIFSVSDDGDPTKIWKVDLSGFTTGTTRTFTLPNASTNLCGASVDCAWSTSQTLAGSLTISGANFINLSNILIRNNTAQTPDSGGIETVPASNAILLYENADSNFDFAHPQQTNPSFVGFSAAQNAAFFWRVTHDQTNAVITSGSGSVRLASAASNLLVTGTAPAITSCGTSPSTAVGSSAAGRFTWGSGAADASCTLTFATAYAVAPACHANNETTVVLLRTVASTTVLEIDASVAATVDSDVITYVCIGGS